LSFSWSFIYCIIFLYIFAEFGPYTLDFTSSGRYMALGGRKGHLAIVDMMNLSLIRDFQVCLIFTELALFGFTN
jgi:hypothetical protein